MGKITKHKIEFSVKKEIEVEEIIRDNGDRWYYARVTNGGRPRDSVNSITSEDCLRILEHRAKERAGCLYECEN